jgi:uncharacterized protein (TIGR02145 family)
MRGICRLRLMTFVFLSAVIFLSGCSKDTEEEKKTVTDYDGNVYNIIKIGDQEWMDRNLAVTHYRNGDPLTNALGTVAGGWINYNNDPALGEIYGKLYNSQAVLDARGLAPEGWHVATREDWLNL